MSNLQSASKKRNQRSSDKNNAANANKKNYTSGSMDNLNLPNIEINELHELKEEPAKKPRMIEKSAVPAIKPSTLGGHSYLNTLDSPLSGKESRVMLLDGHNLTPEMLVHLGYDTNMCVELSEESWRAVAEGRAIIDSVIENKETVYGINTGFGNFANVKIAEDELEQLQCNLIRSHAAGVGEPLSLPKTRMLMALRIHVLAKGHSGIRVETLQQFVAALNLNALPRIPCQGTVGASGDLAPLSHLALGLLGEGLMWNKQSQNYEEAAQVLRLVGLKPITLRAKEGLALINGTQLITSIGAEAVVRAKNIARQADVVAAMTVEALKGSARPFHPAIHAVRPHIGQELVAGRFRDLLNWQRTPSEITHSHIGCGKVQDSYTLRCIPQVHGIVHDTIQFSYNILATECNSATDNPMIFAECPVDDVNSHALIDPYTGHIDSNSKHPIIPNRSKGMIISGGNFHGEYPAKALDYLTIGIHEIASVSERRVERLVNPHLSGLPAFLVNEGGLNSGFMIAHCTAAALVSENKTLCHPASVDSLSTSAAQEDHVSMGGFAARKALKVVEHVEYCIAIELLCACQAIDMLRPLHTTKPLEQVWQLVRGKVKAWDSDRYMAPDIEAVVQLLRTNQVWNAVKDSVKPAFH
jgi:histidine ammonia-lyase